LDKVLQGFRAGDNVVWEVDGVDDALPVVLPFTAGGSPEPEAHLFSVREA
jgi:hypothetical protein